MAELTHSFAYLIPSSRDRPKQQNHTLTSGWNLPVSLCNSGHQPSWVTYNLITRGVLFLPHWMVDILVFCLFCICYPFLIVSDLPLGRVLVAWSPGNRVLSDYCVGQWLLSWSTHQMSLVIPHSSVSIWIGWFISLMAIWSAGYPGRLTYSPLAHWVVCWSVHWPGVHLTINWAVGLFTGVSTTPLAPLSPGYFLHLAAWRSVSPLACWWPALLSVSKSVSLSVASESAVPHPCEPLQLVTSVLTWAWRVWREKLISSPRRSFEVLSQPLETKSKVIY